MFADYACYAWALVTVSFILVAGVSTHTARRLANFTKRHADALEAYRNVFAAGKRFPPVQ